MNEHGILMSAPMVRAILAGTKTQTRRLVKPPKGFTIDAPIALRMRCVRNDGDEGDAELKYRDVSAPHGPVGRRLWVRETWCAPGAFAHLKTGRVAYRADTNDGKNPFGHPWKPAIYMPRWASRITLEVTRVRLERVQAITEEDARAEGCWVDEADHGPCDDSARDVYLDLWDTINGAGSWASNPWVWVYEFRRMA